jgi:hypothetical protein
VKPPFSRLLLAPQADKAKFTLKVDQTFIDFSLALTDVCRGYFGTLCGAKLLSMTLLSG